MFGAPPGLKEQNQNSLFSLPPIVGGKKTSSKKNGKQERKKGYTTVESWWYGEVIWWRCTAAFVWLAVFVLFIYASLFMPFSILSFQSTMLLLFCMFLVMFAQQLLRSSSYNQSRVVLCFLIGFFIAYRGEEKDYTSIQTWGAILCLFLGSALAVITVATSTGTVNLNILSECFEVRSEGREPR